jgi:hypothetical protein
MPSLPKVEIPGKEASSFSEQARYLYENGKMKKRVLL